MGHSRLEGWMSSEVFSVKYGLYFDKFKGGHAEAGANPLMPDT